MLSVPWRTITILAILVLLRTTASASETGRALLSRFECNRCHEGTGLAPAPTAKHCVRCHAEILAGTFAASPKALQIWQSHLVSFRTVPSLVAIGDRLQRRFVASFLLRPHDLRPGLIALMPRLALTPTEAQNIAAELVPRETAPPWPEGADLSTGRQLLETRGCATCHRFTGVPAVPASPIPVAIPPAALAEGLSLAPDLRYTRDRVQADRLVGWLKAPAAIKPDTRMPTIPLTDEQAKALAGYILKVPLAPLPPEPPPARLPVLTRKVPFAEVSERVLRRTCWHCHSTAAFAMGDGGPGNTGGLGFAGRGLNVTTYAELASGSLDDRGRRRSVFSPTADGTPRLLAVLLARQRELAEPIAEVPGVRGMPLGLPALSPEQIQLVESWIAQGRPR